MEKFLEKQREFLKKTWELIKSEKFTELVEAFEEQTTWLDKLEKSIKEDKEKLEKAKADEDEKEKTRLKKYAEMFATSWTVKELIKDLTTVKEQLKKSEDRLEKVEWTSKGSSQPDEEIKKSKEELSDVDRLLWCN